MKRKFVTLTLVLLPLFNAYSQSLSDARNAFDRYEYKTAAEYFDNLIKDENKLGLEDLKRITYSYYTLGEYTKCKPYSDSILTYSTVEELFYLINGDVNKGLSNYSKAIESYEQYQSMGGNEDVSLKIRSCKEIPNWKDEDYVYFTEKERNTSFADFVGGNSSNATVYFSETGFDDRNGELNLKEAASDSAELLLARPYIEKKGSLHKITLKDSKFTSITSLSFMPGKEKAIITASYPMKRNVLEQVPNLYWVYFDSVNNELYDLKPFEFSGLKDTSSTAHATINASGNKMVYTKMEKSGSKSDLYYTQFNNGEWSTPVPLSEINTSNNEIYPLFSGDSLLTFSSDGKLGYGGLDIYSAVFEGNSTSKVTHFKAPINSVRDDFNFTYLSQDSALFASNRSGGTGDDDRYFIKFKEEEIIVEETIDTTDYVAEWELKSVYFRFDKFNLEESLPDFKIKELKEILAKDKKYKIHLFGFTDSKGTPEYNKELGMKRVLSVEKALNKKGINSDQMILTSMGEMNQPNDCKPNCSEEDHKLNRVVQIELIYE